MNGQEILSMVLQFVVAPMLPVLLGLAIRALSALADHMKAQAQSNKAALVADVFAELAKSVVAQVEAELRPQVQQALADGKLTAEEGAALKAAALEMLKKHAPENLKAAATELFGGLGLDTWLGGLIERINAGKPVASTTAPLTAENPK